MAAFIVRKCSVCIAQAQQIGVLRGWAMDNDDARMKKLGSEWLKRSFKRWGRRKTGKELASILGIDPSGVTAMKNGTRRIQLSELPKIADFFEEEIPNELFSAVTSPTNIRHPARVLGGSEQSVPLIRVTAIIAAGVWREAGVTVAITDRVPASPKATGYKQYACKIEAEPDRFAICVPYAEARPRPVANDIVHVRRMKSGTYEDTLRIVRLVNGAVQLQLQGNKDKATTLAYPSTSPSEEIEIRGLVLGFYQHASSF